MQFAMKKYLTFLPEYVIMEVRLACAQAGRQIDVLSSFAYIQEKLLLGQHLLASQKTYLYKPALLA